MVTSQISLVGTLERTLPQMPEWESKRAVNETELRLGAVRDRRPWPYCICHTAYFMTNLVTLEPSGDTRNFYMGAIAQEVWGHKSLSGSQGQSPPETEAVCRHCSQILTAETIKI